MMWRALLSMGLALVLTAFAGLHLYWARGGVWPGKDVASLARTVLGGPPGTAFPSAAACVGVAVLLGIATALVLQTGGFVTLLPAQMAVGAAAVAGGVLFLRGAGGFFESHVRPSIIGSPYARWNVRLYSPLSLGLGVGILFLVLGR